MGDFLDFFFFSFPFSSFFDCIHSFLFFFCCLTYRLASVSTTIRLWCACLENGIGMIIPGRGSRVRLQSRSNDQL